MERRDEDDKLIPPKIEDLDLDEAPHGSPSSDNDLDGSGFQGGEEEEEAAENHLIPWEEYEETMKTWIHENFTEDEDLDQDNDVVIAETLEPPPDLTMPLLRYQKEFLAWATKQELSVAGGILADEMGMGKTIQAISLVLSRREVDRAQFGEAVGGTLVICPPVAVSQWLNEIARFTSSGSTKVLVYHGPKRDKNDKEFAKYDFVLTTYSTVESEYRAVDQTKKKSKQEKKNSKDSSSSKQGEEVDDAREDCKKKQLEEKKKETVDVSLALSHPMDSKKSPLHCVKWNRIILDEAHYIKNRRSNTAKAIFVLESTYRWALTETVHVEFCSLPMVVTIDGMYPVPAVFIVECDISVGGTRYIEAGTLMNNYAYVFERLTRLRQAVDHPYLVEYSSSSGANANLLDENKNEQECGLCHDPAAEDCVVTSCKHVFCKTCLTGFSTSLGKFTCPKCSEPLTMDWTTKADTVQGFKASSILNRIKLDNFQTSTKIEALREEIRFMVERDGSAKAIVFSQFTSFLDLINYTLDKCGVGCVQLVGSMTMAARDSAIKKFKEDPNCRIFLMSLKAGGVALNLTVASHVFMMDPWWNPAVERQAQDRIHRIGQYKPIRIVRFIIENTVEEKILMLQKKKEDLFESMVGGSEEDIGKLTEANIRFLFE
ncbi:unnamed protein product [Cochlearia groenlandica]